MQSRNRDKDQRTNIRSPRREGALGGMNWEIGIDIYTLMYIKEVTNENIKRHLLLGRKVMTNIDSILKSRDITLPTNVRLVKAMVFPVVMYGCESRRRRRGWDVSREQHRNMYIIYGETDHQPRWDA